jgi:asparagine N-glycosylation enzyme membrane subunit Stt3
LAMPNSLNALRLSTVARLGSPGKGENTMDEKNLLDLWNTKRSQIIKAQMAPNLMLIGIFVLAAFGKFDGASDAAKYLAIGVAATTGILSMITQYATIREAEALIVDLKRVTNPSELSKKIATSRGLVSLFAIAIVGLGIAVFALVVWAVLV